MKNIKYIWLLNDKFVVVVTDVLNKKQRSYCMSRIKGKNTKPEIVVRRLLYKKGFRYRLRRKDILGKPDLAFIGRRKLIFVHGCFWHRHEGCKYAYTPKTNITKWKEKFRANIRRDAEVMERLIQDGWSILVVWECETKNIDSLSSKLVNFLTREEL